MPSTTAIRLQIETTLANRVPAALTLKIKQAPELFPTGISEVDAVLGPAVPMPHAPKLNQIIQDQPPISNVFLALAWGMNAKNHRRNRHKTLEMPIWPMF
jgi:hypothetical protein